MNDEFGMMNVGGFGIWNFIFWDLFGLCKHEPMGVGVVGVGTASLVGVGVIGFIGLRLAVHRHQVHTPARHGPCPSRSSPEQQPCRPSGAPLSLCRLSWYLSAVRLPQSGPCSIPATALRFAPSRGRYAGPPPWGAARLATLGCTRVMAFVPTPQGLMHKQRPRHGFAWYGLVPPCSVVPSSHSRPQPSGGTAPLAAAAPSTMFQGPASIGQKYRT